ncbi:conserved exported protein of unknown function [Acidithiobacillus ferrivorans]|uniref:Lipoprotein n=1 Tax=Acidithiobacillus ferrivorans TaxID=160808 RepID=A0A060UZ55_9PROT|nr:conserved exported hypothetical protein [Acidithiobacillus ferrivorans]SMH65499.1 conserved exported protein of unknown function [Acidithiobacillus ferrivorans]
MKGGKLLLAVVMVGALAGCASAGAIVPLSRDTYMVEGSGGGGLRTFSHLESLALAKARAYCAGINERMVFVSVHDTGAPTWTPMESDVTFRCVPNR